MTVRKILSWAAVILWMIIIFSLSAQVAEESEQLSSGITGIIIKAVEKFAVNIHLDVGNLNHMVRKNAHFLAYFVLGILTSNAFGTIGLRGYRNIFAALLICILYAASDEAHQLFVPGRSGEVKDVLIDSTGAGAGIGVYLLFLGCICRRRNRAGKSAG